MKPSFKDDCNSTVLSEAWTYTTHTDTTLPCSLVEQWENLALRNCQVIYSLAFFHECQHCLHSKGHQCHYQWNIKHSFVWVINHSIVDLYSNKHNLNWHPTVFKPIFSMAHAFPTRECCECKEKTLQTYVYISRAFLTCSGAALYFEPGSRGLSLLSKAQKIINDCHSLDVVTVLNMNCVGGVCVNVINTHCV